MVEETFIFYWLKNTIKNEVTMSNYQDLKLSGSHKHFFYTLIYNLGCYEDLTCVDPEYGFEYLGEKC